MMLNVPATFGLIALAAPIVRLLFERGRFDAVATAATAGALQFYAIGLIGYSIVRIASPAFYALGRNRTPVKVSVVTVGVNALLNVMLMELIGFRGLALGTSLAALFNAVTLLVLLRSELGGIDGRRLLGSFVRIVVASVAMAAAAFATNTMLESILAGSALVLQLVRVGASIGVALVVLAGTAWLLRIREFHEAVDMVTRRLGFGTGSRSGSSR
jgi:putative peptidoglycan lipid II flippase